MARKTSRRRQTTRRRPTPPSAATPQASSTPSAASASSAASAPASTAARVEMALGARSQPTSRRKGARQILVEDTDPGIPLDQVPFFTKDLARLGITVGAMIVLMVVGAQVLLHFWG
jgi:hypothetical protein